MNLGDLSDNLFLKKFTYQKSDGWLLPTSLFKSRCEVNKRLSKLRDGLNHVKSLLNHYDITSWRKHTNCTNPSGNIAPQIHKTIRPELGTQAWCKFYEILSNTNILGLFDNLERIGTVHLCEAPGSFVCSLNHYLKLNYPDLDHLWIANTLNPYYEGNSHSSCIVDDRFICRTYNSWCMGRDNTGDIFSRGKEIFC